MGIGGSSLGGSGSGTSSSAAVCSSSENLPPRTLARVARDVRDLVKSPPEGVRLVLDGETGIPGSLSEILVSLVSCFASDWFVCFGRCMVRLV